MYCHFLRLLCRASLSGVLFALLISSTSAAPSTHILASLEGGNLEWKVYFFPDPALLAGGERSMAVEFSLEFLHPLVGAPVVDPQWLEEIDGTLIENPGHNPYTGSITNGVQYYTDVPSQLGAAGNVNAIFASLGSTLFDTEGSKLALTFTTEGFCTEPIHYAGLIAQEEDGDLVTFDGMFPTGIIIDIFGDANNDNAVTGADINAVTANFGNIGPPNDGTLLGDANDDGAVTGADINSVTANFGAAYPDCSHLLAATGTPVPEPGTWGVAAAIAALSTVVRRRLRQ